MTPSKPWSQMTPAEQASFLAKVKQFEASQKDTMYSIPREEPVFIPKNPSATKQTRPTKAGRTAMMKSGGSVSSASKRADGCAIKGKTRGKMI